MVSQFNYQITGAWVQCGVKPPFDCIPVPVRMHGSMPQIKLEGQWHDYPKDERRTVATTFYGMSVAGIATDWEIIH